MLVDGRAIAADIYRELKNEISHLDVKPHLTVFTCAPNFETQKFLALKRRKAVEVGIGINVVEFPESITTEEVIQSLRYQLMQTDGVVIQMPFPETVDIDAVIATVPNSCDVDCLHYDGTGREVLPPVVGAMAEIAERYDVLLAAQRAVVVGSGRLVGKPAAVWLQTQGAQVEIVTETTSNRQDIIQAADVLVLGVGKAHIITEQMIKPGAVVFDAGTSESSGELKGDADPKCANRARLFTPVPGGIGPITVAVLFRNLIRLVQRS